MKRDNIRITIGKNIKYQRQKRGWTEEMLAANLGITLKRLRKYESGADSPTCDEMIEIATLFKCSVDDFCNEVIR